ncbi:MAG: glycosyltransferase [Thermoplasmata archaeon]
MKIALFSDTYYPIPDGVSKHLVDYKKELERRGHIVRVYTVFKDEQSNVYGLPSVKFPLYKEYRMALPVYDLYRDLEKFKPDVCHIHTPFVLGTMGYRFSRKRNIPVIGTYHTDFVNMDNTIDFPFVKSLLNLGFHYNMHLYRKIDAVISPSEPMYRQLENYGVESEVIHVGIDLKPFKYRQIKDEFYLFLGRLTYDKGILSVLEAARRMPEKHFIIAGIGPMKNYVEEYAAKYDNIKYLGYVSEEEKIDLLSRAKILVLPSRAETFGVVYVESMASGTPVIASTESREIGILKENYNGWFVKFDDPESIVEKLNFAERQDLKKFGENAYNSSRDYSVESTADILIKRYGELIEDRKRG